jgi:hypothetical protein
MHLYLTSSGIPEMSNLSGPQRKFVRRQCLYPLRNGLGFRGSNVVLTVLAVLLGSYITDILSLGFLGRVSLLAAIVLAAGWLHDLFWLAHWRPEVARFIREHETDIASAA